MGFQIFKIKEGKLILNTITNINSLRVIIVLYRPHFNSEKIDISTGNLNRSVFSTFDNFIL